MKNEHEPVFLTDYDERWPATYAKAADALSHAFAPGIVGGIEHVGSTAVPGMRAKPIVDIVLGVKNLDDIPEKTDPLWTTLGYESADPPGDQEEWLFFIKRDENQERMVHLHIVPHEGVFWRRVIAFRDILREDEALADEYRRLKTTLTVAHGDERLRYLHGKAPFVKRALRRRLGEE